MELNKETTRGEAFGKIKPPQTKSVKEKALEALLFCHCYPAIYAIIAFDKGVN